MSSALSSTVIVSVVFFFFNIKVFQIRKVWRNSERKMDLAVLCDMGAELQEVRQELFPTPIHPDCAPFLGQSVESHDSPS